jgi:predicted RNA-binding protein Jag
MRLAEASGKNLEEAIENGLKILKVRQEEVEYETLSE